MFWWIVGVVIFYASSAYILVLLARMVFDWIQFFTRGFQPRGIVLLLANLVYGLTDPPLRFLRRYIPPLRLGNVALDVGFLVLFIAVSLLGRLGSYIAFLAAA